MKLSEFISEARDEIHMAWTQRAFRRGESVCAIGALDRVAMRHLQDGGVQAHKPAQGALLEKVNEMFPGKYGQWDYIPSFNDVATRTQQDMENLFDKTIIGLEEKGL